jgi:exodeoxyribonuclease V beta subunit
VKPLDLGHVNLDGTHLIEASAGTGKTYTIASLFLRLLLQGNIPIQEILVVTYTVPATDELKTRIRDKLRQAINAFSTGDSKDAFLKDLLDQIEDRPRALSILRVALSGFDEAAISTIHGFCQRMLKELAFETGSPFDLELVTDQAEMVLGAADDFYRLHIVQETIPELVAYVLEKKITPAFFLKLAKKSNLVATVIPNLARPSLEPHLSAYRQAFAEVCDQWGACREELEQLLSDTDTLNQTSYKLANIPGFLEEMDRYLASGGTNLPVPKEVGKFTLGSVRLATKKNKTVPEHPFFLLCGALLNSATDLTARMDEYLTWLKVAFHGFMLQALPERKAKQGLVHFDDLLLRMHHALASPLGTSLANAVGKRFHAALIDEFQDTDHLQYEIFTQCFSTGPLFFIGDPKQAIYSFRGADIFTYKKAAESVEKDLQNTLIHNWRSEPGLIEAVNAVFEKAKDPFVYPWIEFRRAREADKPDREVLAAGDKANLVVWFMGSSGPEPLKVADARVQLCRAVAHEISTLLNGAKQGRVKLGSRELRPSDIAVLVRENTQARAMRDTLRSCNIPCVLFSDENVFFSDEAFAVDVLLNALAEPYHEGKVRTALMSSIFGLGAHEISGLMEDEKAWETWITKFRGYHDLWNRAGFTPAFRRLMDEEGVRTRLLAGDRGERALTNVLHLCELLGQAEVREKLGMQGLLKWLSERRDPAMPVEEEYQLRLESDDDAVRIMTVHKSKGLEFAVVFCPFAWAPVKAGDKGGLLFHDQDGAAFMDLGSVDYARNTTRAEQEALAENVRLLYVALTRAKNRCYMAWGRVKDAETSALNYLIKSHDVYGKENLVEALKLAGADEESMRRELGSHIKAAKAHAVIRDIPVDAPQPLAAEAFPAEDLTARDFNMVIDRSWGIASYTMFIHGQHQRQDAADRDMLVPGVRDALDYAGMPAGAQLKGMREGGKVTPATAKDIFSFPRGARAGTLLHEVFEKIDFTADNAAIRAVVEETLVGHGFDMTWTEAVTGMVSSVLNVDLGGMHLAQVNGLKRLTELEFMFPLKPLTSSILEKALADYMPGYINGDISGKSHTDVRPARDSRTFLNDADAEDFLRHSRESGNPGKNEIPGSPLSRGRQEMHPYGAASDTRESQGEGSEILSLYRSPRLAFDPVKGFLRGFMDLVFMHEGRYYLIDWKSNHLGNSVEDYGQDALLKSMIRDNYILQYHLYTVALHRYLKNRLEGYSYDKHFGGVFYVYLRGVDPARGPEYGIFRARPDEGAVERLCDVLLDTGLQERL